MPKVIHTNAKGLVQSTGSGFPYLDFVSSNQNNLAAGVTITDAQAETAAHGGTPTAGEILAATLTTNAINVCEIDGAGGVGSVYLPAATAGAHVVCNLDTNGAGTNAQTFVASDGTNESAAEAARQAAGGTAAVFAKGYVSGGQNNVSTLSDGADTKLTLTLHGTNSSCAAGSTFSFYCVEDGVWLVARYGAVHGTGAAMTFG